MSQLKTDNLVVRQHERVRCSLSADCCVAPEHAIAISLTPLAADNTGKFSPTICDISRGGIGLRTKTFLPKQARLTVTITDPILPAPVTATVKVQRVVMCDRVPTYELGTALVDPTPELLASIAAVVTKLQNQSPSAGAPKRA